MAKTEARRAKKDNFLITYLKETRAELRKVHWPTQQEARTLTLVVLAVTWLVALPSKPTWKVRVLVALSRAVPLNSDVWMMREISWVS